MADSGGENPPLSVEGAFRMEREALGLKRIGVRLDGVMSSPLARAVETARIVATVIGTPESLRIEPALQPGCRLATLAPALEALSADSLLLVGHQPDMGRLASELVGTFSPVSFPRGGFCRIRVSGWDSLADRAAASLEFLIPPELLEALGTAEAKR